MSESRFNIYYNSPKTKYKSYEDTSFVVGETNLVLDIKADLNIETYNGEFTNDGPGNIGVAISSDGTNYNDSITVKPYETLDLETHKVNKVKLTWIANTAYRSRFW